MTTIPLRLFSYTRCAADEECRRKRYYSREWGGTGLTPVLAGWALLYGNLIHGALEQLAKEGGVEMAKWVSQLQTQGALAGFNFQTIREWTALFEGHVIGFQKTVWPNLMAEYEVAETEKWIEYDVEPGYRFRARQDLLLRNRFDGHLAYIDYKTTSSDKPQWVASWAKSVQLHSSMYALRMSTGVAVQRAVVIGFLKGYTDKKGLLRSPFTYGYANHEFGMTPSYSYTYKASKGWELCSVADEFPSGIQAWVDEMPHEILTAQFPTTGPIFPRDDIAQNWFRQQMIREEEVAEAAELLQVSTSVQQITDILDKYYRQNFSKCEPAFGYPCEFRNICWIPWIEADPIGSGQFKVYEPGFEE